MLYEFDTDHLSLSQRCDPVVGNRLHNFDDDENTLVTTAINLQEQISGRFEQIQRAKTPVALGKSSIRIGTMDLRIASICIVNNAILVTRNRKDFQQVPDLNFEDWSV
jgi:tRNA(fMet)-specific endonuclease VapC